MYPGKLGGRSVPLGCKRAPLNGHAGDQCKPPENPISSQRHLLPWLRPLPTILPRATSLSLSTLSFFFSFITLVPEESWKSEIIASPVMPAGQGAGQGERGQRPQEEGANGVSSNWKGISVLSSCKRGK